MFRRNAVSVQFKKAGVVNKILRRRQRLGALALKNQKIRAQRSQSRQRVSVFPMIVKECAAGSDRMNIDINVER